VLLPCPDFGLKKNAQVAEIDRFASAESGSLGFADELQLDHPFKDLAGTVGRTIVHKHDFLAKLGFDDTAKDLINRGFLAVDRSDHGELGSTNGSGCGDKTS
jgi:hypothetical protein